MMIIFWVHSTFFIFLFFSSTGSVPFVEQPLRDAFVGKYDNYEGDIHPDTFQSDDNTIVTVFAEKNELINSRYNDPNLKTLYDTFSSYDVVVEGDYAYVLDVLYGLRIFDISTPSSPIMVGSVYTITSSEITEGGVFVSGNFAYLSADGFKIIDITNKEEPELLSTSLNDMKCASSYVSGNYAYVAAYFEGLFVLDISNPLDPQIVYNYVIGGEFDGEIYDIVVDGDYAYFMYWNVFYVFDVSDPTDPIKVGENLEGETGCSKIDKWEDYVFVPCGNTGLFIYDVWDHSDPYIWGAIWYETADPRSADHVHATSEGLLFLSDSQYNTVFIIDASVLPVTPDYLSSISIPESIESFAPTSTAFSSSSNTLVISIGVGGMMLEDLSEVTTPNTLAEVQYSSNAISVAFLDYLYVASVNGISYSIGVFKVHEDDSKPTLLTVYQSSYGSGEIQEIQVRRLSSGETFLYYLVSGQFYILDVSDPYEIEEVAMQVDGIYYKEGTYVYFSFYVSESGGVGIFDITDLSDVSDVGYVYLTGYDDEIYRFEKLFVSDGYIYQAGLDLGLKIIDSRDVTDPRLVSTTLTPDEVHDVHVSGNFAYCAEIEVGLQIYNISDRVNPILISNFYSPLATHITYQDNIVYLSCGVNGLSIIDVSDPFVPTLISKIPTYTAQGIYVQGNLVFLADSDQGVKIFDQTLRLFGTSEFSSSFSGDVGITITAFDLTGEIFNEFTITREDMCNGKGTRNGYSCQCEEGYLGDYCDTWTCGYDYKSDESCSGNGECLSPNSCVCNAGYAGDLCEENTLYATVLAPVLGTSGVLFIFFCLSCCVLCCIVVSVVLCCLCVILSFLSCFVCAQRLRLRKFDQLQHLDLLLQEQKMENKDDSTAHLEIDKSLFEIDMKEIHFVKIIGSGGSNSTVYRATWKNKLVAFKCFKTRQVCGSQDDFEEFQRELIVFGSVSHPNIVRFFGACLAPPRVGILMEFCENGDLDFFLRRHSIETDGLKFDFYEKMRMAMEIASSMTYLHSRNIIHRDLKLENVLVDSKQCCKLMDFGLSKIVNRMSQEKTRQIGTSIYMSPEICNTGKYDEKCDVFSYSILLFVLFTEEMNPYGLGEDLYRVEMKVANDENFRPDISLIDNEPTIERNQKKFLKDIITQCWKEDPSERYSFKEISEKFDQKNQSIGMGSLDLYRKRVENHFQDNSGSNYSYNNKKSNNKKDKKEEDGKKKKENMLLVIENMKKEMEEMKDFYEKKMEDTERKYQQKLSSLMEKKMTGSFSTKRDVLFERKIIGDDNRPVVIPGRRSNNSERKNSPPPIPGGRKGGTPPKIQTRRNQY